MDAVITIPLDADTAKLYHQMPADLREKVVLLLSLQLRDLIAESRPLQAIMDEISQRAEARGLTPEVLASLLSEEMDRPPDAGI
jgi:hypothetical protein